MGDTGKVKSRVQNQYPWRWDSPSKEQARLMLVWYGRPRPDRKTHSQSGTQPNSANSNPGYLLAACLLRRHRPGDFGVAKMAGTGVGK
ncbi:hypothetical protein ColTof4_02057 [Colletotrichum tofieldiae]|nr:hypothetical protein ColTof3_09658 [Colletotrichum tofieldiae]GKT69634.1 hypothetical protein ColTof4_02057 [Colletotrichum tofieldiae]